MCIRDREILFVPKDANEIRAAIKNIFNTYSSIDQVNETVERLRRDARRAQSWCGSSKEVLAELALAYKANTVAACYLDTHIVRTLLDGAHEAREANHEKALRTEKDKLAEMEKDKNKDKDKDKAKQLSAQKKKIENLEGSYPALTDGECTLSRIQDGSFRMTMKEGDHTALDADGLLVLEACTVVAKCFARLQYVTERMELGLQVTYVDPAVNVLYQKHRLQQDQLDAQIRRLLSIEGRLASAEKKEKTGADTLQQKQEEMQDYQLIVKG